MPWEVRFEVWRVGACPGKYGLRYGALVHACCSGKLLECLMVDGRAWRELVNKACFRASLCSETSYLNASWWMVDTCMARIGESELTAAQVGNLLASLDKSSAGRGNLLTLVDRSSAHR